MRLLFLCVVLLLSGTIFMKYNHKEDFPAVLINKYERLSLLKDKRKIIIAGGSSSSYSINSEKLQEVFETPVVNTSLAMGLGSEFQLNLTKDYLKKGDVVLYIPEYEFYYDKTSGDDFLYTSVFYYPKMLKDFTVYQKKEMLVRSIKLSLDFYKGYYSSFNKKRNRNDKETKINQYSRLAYNYLGDNITLINENSSLIQTSSSNRFDKLKTKELSKAFIQKLKEFNNLCESSGVAFFIAFPPIEESQFSNHFFEDINLIKEITSLNFIGNPKEDVYEKELFYDTSYHLIGKGREIRTDKLIKRLQKEQFLK